MGHRLRRASNVTTGYSISIFVPLAWVMLAGEEISDFSLSLKRHVLCILLRSLSPNIPVSA